MTNYKKMRIEVGISMKLDIRDWKIGKQIHDIFSEWSRR